MRTTTGSPLLRDLCWPASWSRRWTTCSSAARTSSLRRTRRKRFGRLPPASRYAYTHRCPAFDAKARGSTSFPDRIPLSWFEFDSAIKNDAARVDLLLAEIDKMLAAIEDPEVYGAGARVLKQWPSKTVEAHTRVSALFEEKTAAPQQEVAK